MSFAAPPTIGIPPSMPISDLLTAPPKNLTPPPTAEPREPLIKGKRAGQINLSAKAPIPNLNKVPKRLLPFCCSTG